MQRQCRRLGHLMLLMGLTVAALALSVGATEKSSRSVRPRLVATVTVLEPRGLALIQTVDGASYEVFAGPHWRVGDPVTCEHNEWTRVPWQQLDCRKDA
jgi:hypothetical protein